MSISSAFIARPIATSLLMAGIPLVGAAAYPLLPVAPLPQVDFPTIQVTTQLPGASPEVMASSVTQPLERQFGQIPGVTQMTSSSTLGNSAITVQFDLSRNIDGAAQDIQTAINAASGQLPKNLPSPYRKVNPADAPILVLALTSDTVSADRSRRLRREHPRPAHQPDFRRCQRGGRRPAKAIGAHPGRSGEGRSASRSRIAWGDR
jgi:HAE1 family hydrophobic/amphiphilic exporter-1